VILCNNKVLGKLVMKQLAERVFEKSEKNLNLLLGALTYATWFVCYIFIAYRLS